MMTIEWKDLGLHGFPGYEVSNDGRVRRSAGARGTTIGREVRPHAVPRSGLLRLQLRVDGGPKNVFVHRLVLFAFVGPCPPGMECRHLDGDPTNNHVENLRWGTHLENMRDRVRHGTAPDLVGGKNPNSKLTEDDVREIRRRVESGEKQRRIAEDYGLTPGAISAIKTRRSWGHL